MNILDTKASLEQADLLLSFENQTYGSDFWSKQEDLAHWYKYDTFFCSAILSESGYPRSICSLLVTTRDSMSNLLEGSIRESELEAWNPDSFSMPVYYYSSLILGNLSDGKALFTSITTELKHKSSVWSKLPNTVYAIGCSHAGQVYLKKEGFEVMPYYYLRRHQFFEAFGDNQCRGLFRMVFGLIVEEPVG